MVTCTLSQNVTVNTNRCLDVLNFSHVIMNLTNRATLLESLSNVMINHSFENQQNNCSLNPALRIVRENTCTGFLYFTHPFVLAHFYFLSMYVFYCL